MDIVTNARNMSRPSLLVNTLNFAKKIRSYNLAVPKVYLVILSYKINGTVVQFPLYPLLENMP